MKNLNAMIWGCLIGVIVAKIIDANQSHAPKHEKFDSVADSIVVDIQKRLSPGEHILLIDKADTTFFSCDTFYHHSIIPPIN